MILAVTGGRDIVVDPALWLAFRDAVRARVSTMPYAVLRHGPDDGAIAEAGTWLGLAVVRYDDHAAMLEGPPGARSLFVFDEPRPTRWSVNTIALATKRGIEIVHVR